MGYDIELTDDEREILKDIELDQTALDHEQYKRQAPLVLKLVTSLFERNAIPQIRLKYWSDPEYYLGRSKMSHKELFERNGKKDNEIFVEPSFLPYLRYFLSGAQLPAAAIAEFETVVGDPEWVSSGDTRKISKGTREIVRKYGLQAEDEEFYRLALDMGLNRSFARSVRGCGESSSLSHADAQLPPKEAKQAVVTGWRRRVHPTLMGHSYPANRKP